MRVITNHDVVRNRIDIYVSPMEGKAWTYDPRGRHVMHDVPPDNPMPVFLSLGPELAIEISSALSKEQRLQPSPSIVEHLEDAVKVRDRLLNMLEHRWMTE